MLYSQATFWLAAIALVFLPLAVRYWRPAIFVVFVLLVFEGAMRKWVLPSAQAQIYLAKDIILLCAYLGFLLHGGRDRHSPRNTGAIRIVLILAFVFGCVQILNPYSPSILVGLVGVKTYFLYAPLAFILPHAFTSREQLLKAIWWYLLIAIPVAILGFAQIAAGPGSFLNTYVSHNEDTAAGISFGRDYALVRTSGTFSFIAGYTAYLGFMAFLAIGFNLAQGWRVRNNVVPIAALTLVAGAMFTTGSRAPVYILIATVPIILWWAAIAGLLAFQTAMRLCILLPVVAVAALNVSPQAFEAFMHRASESTDTTSERLFSGVFELIGALGDTPVLGLGIGVTHPSAMSIMGTTSLWWLRDVFVEGEIARVAAELGIVGVLLIFGLRILIAASAVRCTLAFKDPAYRALGIALTIHLALGITSSIMLNVTAGLYYWGALGLIFAMQRLERDGQVAVRRKQPSNGFVRTAGLVN
jgi:hypothetical protein